MPDLNLSRLADLSERATPAPWTMRPDENIEGADGRIIHADGRQHTVDAELIWMMRNALPALIQAARERDELRANMLAIKNLVDARLTTSAHAKIALSMARDLVDEALRGDGGAG